ncbi:MAG: type IVB secretion system protein IcmV [Gammaproteobacteria bacterium]
MAIKEILKVNRKTFFNPRAWLGYDYVKAQSLGLFGTIKLLFGAKIEEGPQDETFEQAKQRLNLTDEDIATTEMNYLLLTAFYASVGFVIVCAAFYLLITDASYAAFILALALSTVLFGQAFRSHFWYFQIKSRKLGCTFDEWRKGISNKEGSS